MDAINSIYNKEQSKVRKLLGFVDMNNYNAFKDLFTSSKLSMESINDLFMMSFASYSTGNNMIVPYITFLLSQGANANINLYSKSLSKPLINSVLTPLNVALQHNDYYLVKQLLDALDLSNQAITMPQGILEYFCEPLSNRIPNYDILKLFLSKRLMSLSHSDLSKIILSNSLKLINYLLNVKVINVNEIIDKDNNTLLHYAIIHYKGNTDIIELLIKHNSDMTIKNIKGESCLDLLFQLRDFPNEVSSSLIKAYDSQLSLMSNIKEENNNNLNNKAMADNKYKFNPDTKMDLSDYAFKFPLDNSFNNINLPFSIQNAIGSNQSESKRQFYSYIKIKDRPTLILDSSIDYPSDDNQSLQEQIDNYKSLNQQQEALIKALENKIIKTNNSNDLINNEIKTLREELNNRDTKIAKMNSTIKENEELHKKKIDGFNATYDEKTKHYLFLKEQYNQLENDSSKYKTLINNKKNNHSNSNENVIESFNQLNIDYMNSVNFFRKKFISEGYNDIYIQECLQIDLLDFQEHVKEQIKLLKPKLEELINLLQTSVNESIGSEYEAKLYGSHATNLCLPWSDLDVVIVKHGNCVSSYLPLHELFKHMHDNNYFRSINYIGNTNIPLIKIHTNENFNNMSVDISLQDSKHYGIQCVALVNDLIKQYDVLVPMVLALKNILKQANLNDPYKVRRIS